MSHVLDLIAVTLTALSPFLFVAGLLVLAGWPDRREARGGAAPNAPTPAPPPPGGALAPPAGGRAPGAREAAGRVAQGGGGGGTVGAEFRRSGIVSPERGGEGGFPWGGN